MRPVEARHADRLRRRRASGRADAGGRAAGRRRRSRRASWQPCTLRRCIVRPPKRRAAWKRSGSSTTCGRSRGRYDLESLMSSSLAPALLLSMPQLVDPNFNRTVVLLCKQSEEGAFGLIVNRPLITTGRIVVNLDPPVEQPDHDLQVWVGGPVEPERHWILVGDEPDDDQ